MRYTVFRTPSRRGSKAWYKWAGPSMKRWRFGPTDSPTKKGPR